jgi:hypothetical protein
MKLPLAKTYPRLWTLEAGMVMVVTDLHGDWEAYQRYRDRFVDLQARGLADWLIFTGDLIHSDLPGPADQSLPIVLDVITLQEHYGPAVIYLCGNHELPHLYSVSLAKGNRVYTPDFEKALSQSGRRAQVIELFDSLPFFIRTRAGVALAHAGAPPPMTNPQDAGAIFNWSHKKILAQAEAEMGQENREILRQSYARLFQGTYQSLVNYYLDVAEPDDPRYDHLLRGFFVSNMAEFNDLLWPALFTRCEREYGTAHYAIFLDALLKELSVGFVTQNWLVAGHMRATGGHKLVVNRHLRLASGKHADPREAGHYLLFDAAKPIHQVETLFSGLKAGFPAG